MHRASLFYLDLNDSSFVNLFTIWMKLTNVNIKFTDNKKILNYIDEIN